MITQRTVNNVAIFEPQQALQGESLQQQVLAALGSDNRPNVAINLSTVSYIDSSGLGLLVSLHKHCEARQCQFALFGLQAYVQRLVEVIRLNRVLKIYEDETTTLAALCEDPATATATDRF
jgi:anti-sigma B factor antagonist